MLAGPPIVQRGGNKNSSQVRVGRFRRKPLK
jgi:hypothetical protein